VRRTPGMKGGHSRAGISACFMAASAETRGAMSSMPWGAYVGETLVCSGYSRRQLEENYPESEGYLVTSKAEMEAAKAAEGMSET